mmetsp:Transcript_39271/g.103558  ORF Transcript_39271/g.103558 Transcript_39271/m.103558 type:complete len:210 (-) Transcript_39271:199-828(-)
MWAFAAGAGVCALEGIATGGERAPAVPTHATRSAASVLGTVAELGTETAIRAAGATIAATLAHAASPAATVSAAVVAASLVRTATPPPIAAAVTVRGLKGAPHAKRPWLGMPTGRRYAAGEAASKAPIGPGAVQACSFSIGADAGAARPDLHAGLADWRCAWHGRTTANRHAEWAELRLHRLHRAWRWRHPLAHASRVPRLGRARSSRA